MSLNDIEVELIPKSELVNELNNKRANYEAELRKEYRSHGLEYKSNSKILGSGKAKDPMVYKIRKFIIFHLIENPHLAKRGAFRRVWEDKYSQVLPYDGNVTNNDIGKQDRLDIIAKLKEHHMYKRVSFKRMGSIMNLIQSQHEQKLLRIEVAELKDMLSMYREGTSIVINNVVYRGDDNYYYLPDKDGKQQRVRKGAFTKAFDVAIEYGLIEEAIE